MKNVSPEVTTLISHATEVCIYPLIFKEPDFIGTDINITFFQERLRNIMERLAVISRHRVETLKVRHTR